MQTHNLVFAVKQNRQNQTKYCIFKSEKALEGAERRVTHDFYPGDQTETETKSQRLRPEPERLLS